MAAGTDISFKIRNTLVVNTAFSVNSTGIYFGASPTLSLNSTFYAGQSAFVNTAGNFTISGNLTVSNALIASGSSGDPGQALLSANTYTYWSTLATSAFTNTTNATNITTGQMSSARVSGLATSATTDTTNAANITTGQMSYNRISGLAASATTDTTSATNITTGQMASARVSGLATSATTDTTNASNITTGTLPVGQVPANVVLKDVTNQVITGGARVTPYTIPQGSTTLDSGNGPLQYYLNSQTATITAPSNDGSFVMFVNNAASANTVTWSGFTYAGSNYGDPYVLTANNKFLFYINRTVGISTFVCKALQ